MTKLFIRTAIKAVLNWLEESLVVFWKVCKIMLPAIVLVKFLQLGELDQLLANWLTPTMQLVGLPGYAGLVWATAIVANIYSALAVFVIYWQAQPLSIAEVSVLGLMILIAHSLVIEVIIAQRAGSRLVFSLFWRLCNAYFLGWAVHWLCHHFSLFQQPAKIALITLQTDSSWSGWLLEQFYMLLMMLIFISLMVAIIQCLQRLGLEQRLHQLMTPFLRLFSLSDSSANITIVGMILGISYGAGLLIRDVESDRVSREDGSVVMSILNLNHALIEDTLLMVLLGCSLWIVLGARLILGLSLAWLYSYLLKTRPIVKRLTVC